MARFRNVSHDDRIVGYGFSGTKMVAPDEPLVVPDTVAIAYAGQPDVWAPDDAAAQSAEGEYNEALAYFEASVKPTESAPAPVAPPVPAPAPAPVPQSPPPASPTPEPAAPVPGVQPTEGATS